MYREPKLATDKEIDPKHAIAHIRLGDVLWTVRKDSDGAETHY